MLKKYLSGAALLAAAVTVTLPMVLAGGGCISRVAYQRNMNKFAAQLQNARTAHARELERYDRRLRDKNDTILKLTERYMALQKSNAEAQGKLNSLKGDLEALLRDTAELKMVIFHNVKGSEGNEMMIKLMEMQHRIKSILKKESVEE